MLFFDCFHPPLKHFRPKISVLVNPSVVDHWKGMFQWRYYHNSEEKTMLCEWVSRTASSDCWLIRLFLKEFIQEVLWHVRKNPSLTILVQWCPSSKVNHVELDLHSSVYVCWHKLTFCWWFKQNLPKVPESQLFHSCYFLYLHMTAVAGV